MTLEKPKIEKIEKDKNYVYEQFKSVDFDIKSFPELHERLVELANMPDSHFEDAVKMAEVVNLLWEDIKKEDNISFSLEEMQLACLFHDIGKSGPAEADREERLMVEQIFNPVFFNADSERFKKAFPDVGLKERKKFLRDSSIEKILEVQGFPNNQEIKKYLETLTVHIYDPKKKKIIEEQLDLNKHTMIQLWREHDYWTYELLKKYGDNKIPEELVVTASTHHALEGHDPAMIDGSIPNEAVTLELLDKYSILTLVDKYQAFIDREKISHDETIVILGKMIDESKSNGIINHDGSVYNQFRKYLSVLANHPEIAEKIK